MHYALSMNVWYFMDVCQGICEYVQSPGHTAICLQKSAQYRNSTSESTE